MRRDDVMSRIRAHRDELDRFHIRSLSIFGSVARDEAREDSDVDILAEFDRPPAFLDYMDAKFALEDWLGAPVDLATPSSLKPMLKSQVEREAIRVA